MAINNSRQYFLDTLVELTGIKSGLAVTIPKTIELLAEGVDPARRWWQGEPEEWVRIDFGDFQREFTRLLHSIGATPDPYAPKDLVWRFCRQIQIPVPPEEDGDELAEMMGPEVNAFSYLHAVVIDCIRDRQALPAALQSVPGINDLLREYEHRDVMSHSMPASRSWDGVLSLRDLFESEDAPTKPDTFFDQRFIDYLHAQPGELSKMHWRQFEYLAGEFFRRNGYRVLIGPGRDDGGKDVVARKDSPIVGPELIYVQCKRIGDHREVDIDAVKAFWATVDDANATKGLIATTSRLAAGARSYCEARSYRLTMAEGDKVANWISQMSTHGER